MRMLERVLRKARSPGTEDMVEGYCLKCQAHRQMKDSNREYMKNGRPRVRGSCVVCDARMSVLIKG